MKTGVGRVALIGLLAALAWGTFAINAEAATSFDLNFVFSGNNPNGPAPWASATFTAVDSTHVDLALAGHLGSGGQFITEWDFNVADAFIGITSAAVQVACATCTAPTIRAISSNAYQADGDGKYDIELDFATAGGGSLPSATRFDDSDTITIRFTCTAS